MSLTENFISELDHAAKTAVRLRKQEWPMDACFASGVNAAQAEQLSDFLGARDCPTEVTPNGDPIYTSPSHRRKALELRHMCDNALRN